MLHQFKPNIKPFWTKTALQFTVKTRQEMKTHRWLKPLCGPRRYDGGGSRLTSGHRSPGTDCWRFHPVQRGGQCDGEQ